MGRGKQYGLEADYDRKCCTSEGNFGSPSYETSGMKANVVREVATRNNRATLLSAGLISLLRIILKGNKCRTRCQLQVWNKLDEPVV